ncbi:hypothetical protein CO60_1828 [Mycobacterium tuberculosis]|nr:hypothetical protein CO60_1828 [Mycobacterium tuberculosis]
MLRPRHVKFSSELGSHTTRSQSQQRRLAAIWMDPPILETLRYERS